MENKQIRKIFSRIGLSMFLLMAVMLVVVFIASLVVLIVAPHIMEAGWYLWLISYLPLYLVAFPICLLVLRTIPSHPMEAPRVSRIPAGHFIGLVCVSMAIVYILNLVSTGLSMIVAYFKNGEVVNPLLEMLMEANPLASVFFVVIVAPVMEEIIFRKMLYHKLAPFGPKVYMVVSALLFAMFHANLFQLLYAFVLGLILGAITYYTGGIRYSILLHMVINLLGSGVGILLLTYAGEAAAGVWGIVMLCVVMAGIVLGIVWWRRHRGKITLPQGSVPLPSKGVVVANVGMILYLALTLIYTVYALLMV